MNIERSESLHGTLTSYLREAQLSGGEIQIYATKHTVYHTLFHTARNAKLTY